MAAHDPMTPQSAIETKVHRDLDALSRAVAAEIARVAEHAVEERGRFMISLAGGSTPRHLYELLASEYRDRIPWRATHIFFGDERCVPPADSASNYHMAHEALLSRVPIPDAQVHRIHGERSPVEAAREYGRLLRRSFDHAERMPAASSPPAGAATFDITLLGVGGDGHTASLFPDSPALDEERHWVVEVDAPEYIPPPRQRITLTLAPLNAATDVYFLVAGEEKRGVVGDILGAGSARPSPYPAARVRGTHRTVWWLDRPAAGALAAGGDALR